MKDLKICLCFILVSTLISSGFTQTNVFMTQQWEVHHANHIADEIKAKLEDATLTDARRSQLYSHYPPKLEELGSSPTVNQEIIEMYKHLAKFNTNKGEGTDAEVDIDQVTRALAFGREFLPAKMHPEWEPVTVMSNGIFNFKKRPEVQGCGEYVDFTFFQTTVFVTDKPKYCYVSYHHSDDATRVYVFNEAHPNGTTDVGTDMIFKDGKHYNGHGDLVKDDIHNNIGHELAVGENRIVIVHFDRCGGGNSLNKIQLKITTGNVKYQGNLPCEGQLGLIHIAPSVKVDGITIELMVHNASMLTLFPPGGPNSAFELENAIHKPKPESFAAKGFDPKTTDERQIAGAGILEEVGPRKNLVVWTLERQESGKPIVLKWQGQYAQSCRTSGNEVFLEIE